MCPDPNFRISPIDHCSLISFFYIACWKIDDYTEIKTTTDDPYNEHIDTQLV